MSATAAPKGRETGFQEPDESGIGARIRGLRKRLKLTQEAFAELIGTSQGSVSNWENGRDRPTDEFLNRMAEAGGVTPGFLRYGDEIAGRVVPVLGIVGAGAEVHAFDDHEMGANFYEKEAPSAVPFGAVGLEVRGDSLYPDMEDGDVVVYRRDAGFEEAGCLNRRCVVRLLDGRTLVKRLVRGSEFGRHTLLSSNAPPLENVEIEWAAPLIAVLYR